ncbi:MAG: glycosyltransferase [Lachnospiraceae bacterium]|nr:glycosyltransferase [Lachnospiraceae bacterium]
MEHMNIVYAFSGEMYAKLSMISMRSILKHAKEDFVCFKLLVDASFHEEDIFDNCIRDYSNCQIEYIRMDKTLFENAELHISHINVATYYRLLLPELLKTEEKCIYLDSDTIVKSSLYDLYKVNVDDVYAAGVLAPNYYNNPKAFEYCQKTGIKDLKKYINAGVLVLNLYKMRQDGIAAKFMELIATPFPSQDQDIINRVCYGKIKLLPFTYNVMTKYATWSIEQYGKCIQQEELIDAWNNPQIIHYADKVKPWNNPNAVFSDYWWKICKETKFYEEFILDLGKIYLFESLYDSSCRMNGVLKKHEPILYDLTKKKIVIFGAGKQAKDFISILLVNNLKPEYIIVTNKDENENFIQSIPVYSLSEIEIDNEDITVVIATNSKFHKEIVDIVEKYNFQEIISLDDWLTDWKFG